MKHHYFIGQKKSPYHLSVGAVLLNSKNQVCCHHLLGTEGARDVYLLMCETLDPDESLERGVRRGLKEEFGAQGKIIRYLGSIESSFKNWQKVPVRKTTLYFLCRIIGSPKKTKHIESHGGKGSKTEWKSARFLISQMKKQGKLLKRSDFDESEVLKRIG